MFRSLSLSLSSFALDPGDIEHGRCYGRRSSHIGSPKPSRSCPPRCPSTQTRAFGSAPSIQPRQPHACTTSPRGLAETTRALTKINFRVSLPLPLHPRNAHAMPVAPAPPTGTRLGLAGPAKRGRPNHTGELALDAFAI